MYVCFRCRNWLRITTGSILETSPQSSPTRGSTSVLLEEIQQSLGSAYTIDRELGGGGMSRVFLATENRLNRKVVVKVLSPELAASVSADRFEREIQLAAQLQQANIVPLLATGEANGLPYFTMPFVEGESLRTRMRAQGQFTITECVGILRDVARALSYAHAAGVVHRDIKPDNVLLSHGAAVVTDFGIAKALSDSRSEPGSSSLTQTGSSLGSPAYMAPEPLAGDPNVDHRADLYAFGCMGYELLTGEPPFTAESPQRVFAAHLTEKPRPVAARRSDVPRPLAAMIMRCLEKDPRDRPQRRGASAVGAGINLDLGFDDGSWIASRWIRAEHPSYRRCRLSACSRRRSRRRRQEVLRFHRRFAGRQVGRRGIVAAALEAVGEHEKAVQTLREAVHGHDLWLAHYFSAAPYDAFAQGSPRAGASRRLQRARA
jgi:serine/threonine protein kinase